MWKLVLIIFAIMYVLAMITDVIKSRDRKKFIKNLSKTKILILILVVIVMPSYYIGRDIILKNKIREDVEQSQIYKYVDSYELLGFKNSIINLKVKDDFGKLDDNTKLKYAKEIYSSVQSTIIRYCDISNDENSRTQLVNDHKVIINASEGQYKFEYESLEKPDGKEIKDSTNNSSNSSTTTESYSNDKTLHSGQSILLNKDELVCSSKSNLDKLLSFINQKNKDSENQMLLNGQATILRKGTRVNVIDAGIAVTEIETSNGERWFAPRETIEDAL